MVITSFTCAHAKDLGTYGETFAILEIDLLKLLGAKLKSAEKSGQMQALNQTFAQTALRHIEEPAPLLGIRHTTEPKTWLFDPSIIVSRDFADQRGRVFAHKGEHINPLERLPNYKKTLIFIDGRDAEQVSFALKLRKSAGAVNCLIILTNGAPLRLMRSQKVPFFYDQQGLLVRRFTITQVPATVTREGLYLRIREVRP
jgi:conjugal transfer pilus assembly protein TraW